MDSHTQLSTKEDMPSCYRIQVLNLQDEECIPHSLALLKGQVSTLDKVSITGMISVSNCDKHSDWPVSAGQFKVLVSLQRGWNNVTLTFKSSSVTLRLQFECHDPGYYVVPVYIVSHDHDGQFQAPDGTDCSVLSAVTRINLSVRLLQTIIAEKLKELGLGRRTFTVKEECVLHSSPISIQEAQNMKQVELWECYGRELVTKFGVAESSRYKFLAFLACTRYTGSERSSGMTYEEILAHTVGHVALGGGGLAIFGTGCLHTWPSSETEVLSCLQSNVPVDQSRFMDDSCYRGTYGGCFATTLGSVLHELCHTFDLGHTDKGVMGRGFDHMDLVLGEEVTADVNSNVGIHATVDFTVNLRVDCAVQQQVLKNSSLVHKSQRGGRQMPPHSTDRTFFTKSCAFMLAYHRWFNGVVEGSDCDMTFDERSWTLRSLAGLRVVEVREGDRQVVRASWCFCPARQLFVVPLSSLPSKVSPPILLVAEDSVGNILRSPLVLDHTN